MKIQNIFAICLLFLFIQKGSSQNWLSTGLNGISGGKIAERNNILYLATAGGLYQSNNQGKTWIYPSCKNDFCPTLGVIKEVVSNDSALYIISNNSLYKSKDGITWTSAMNGLNSAGSDYDYNRPKLLNIGNILFLNNNGIYKSSDNGESWTKLENTISNSLIRIDFSLFIYENTQLKYSSDGENFSVYPLEGLPGAPTSLSGYNGKLFAVSRSQVYSSSAGNKWILASDGLDSTSSPSLQYINKKFFAYTFKGNHVALYVFDSAQNKWTVFPMDGFSHWSNFSINYAGGKYFAYSGSSLYYWDEIKKSWTQTDNGLKAFDLKEITFVGNVLLRRMAHKIQRSEDNGLTWSTHNIIGKNYYYSNADVSKTLYALNNNLIIAPVYYPSFNLENDTIAMKTIGFYISSDTGKTWHKTGSPGNFNPHVYYAIQSNNSKKLFVRVHPWYSNGICLGCDTLWVSEDNGYTWRKDNTSGFKAKKIVKNEVTAIATGNNPYLYRSQDDEQSWESLNIRDSSNYLGQSICVSGSQFYNLQRKTSGFGFRIFKSLNGSSWEEGKAIGLPSYTQYEIKKFTSFNNVLYTVLHHYPTLEIYASKDNGDSWFPISTPSGLILSGAMAFVNDFILVGTEQQGLWAAPSEKVLSVQNFSFPLNEDFIKIYPNPASETATLEINMAENAEVDIEICNSLGKTIYQINEKKESGKQIIALDLKGLDSGFYLIMIKTEQRIVSKKLLINR